MSGHRNLLCCIGAVLMCLPLTRLAAGAQVPVGARALGMGGAFTAVADDVSGPFWNPAGVVAVRGLHVNLFSGNVRLVGQEKIFDLIRHTPSNTDELVDWVSKFGDENTAIASGGIIGVTSQGWAFSILPLAGGVLSPNGGDGFQYVTTPDGHRVPVEGSVGTVAGTYGYYFMGTWGTQVGPKTTFGVNAKLLTSKAAIGTVRFTDNLGNATVTTVTEGASNRWGMDLGVQHVVNDRWTLGATFFNFAQPGTDFFPRNLNIGAAFRPLGRGSRLTLAMDIAGITSGNQDINYGGEFGVSGIVTVRAGLYKGRPTLGVGVGSMFSVVYSPDNSLVGVSFAL